MQNVFDHLRFYGIMAGNGRYLTLPPQPEDVY